MFGNYILRCLVCSANTCARKLLNVAPLSDRLLAAPAQSQLLVDQEKMQKLATHITDLVYGRLSTLPPAAMPISGRAFTLPDGDANASSSSIQTEEHQHEIDETKSKMKISSCQISPSQKEDDKSSHDREVGASYRAQQESGSLLTGGINKHLQELNLEELSEEEIERLGRLSLPYLFTETTKSATKDRLARPVREDTRSRDAGNARQNSRLKFYPDVRAPRIDPLLKLDPSAALNMAADLTQLVDIASKIATQATSLYRDIGEKGKQLFLFSRRLLQYSQLIGVVAENILSLDDDGNLRPVVDQLMSGTRTTLSEADIVLERLEKRKSGFMFSVTTLRTSWRTNMKEIVRLMDEIEVLKPNLIIVLQTLQIRAQRKTNAKLYRRDPIAEGETERLFREFFDNNPI